MCLNTKVNSPIKAYFGKIAVAGLILFGSVTTSGCATWKEAFSSGDSDLDIAMASRDLLFALTQILPPDDTTIQYTNSDSKFGQELEKGLRELGYGMQRMQGDHGPMFLTYSRANKTSNTNGDSTYYSIFVGNIGLERVYADVKGGGVIPMGPMNVHGTDKPVVLSEDIFPQQNKEVQYVEAEANEIDKSAIVVVNQNVMDAIKQFRNSPIPSYSALNFQKEKIENVALLGKSNFTEVDRDYRMVRKDIIIFPNDSMLLLDKGRQQIRKLVSLYREDTDVFRLVGCSHGKTSIEGGNEALALGRSERIAKELISRKVSKSNIRDEGCWAGEAVGDWPGRGVVVELQRKNS